MQIQKLKLQSFRNYDTADLQFKKNIILIVGNNAQGKTNLVESIYTLAFSKSYRTQTMNDLIKEMNAFGKINANICFAQKKEKNIEYILTKKKKRIKVNNVEQKTKSEFVGLINVIKFSPEDLTLIKGTPSIRRKFIDMYLSQLDKEYLYVLVRYNHLIKQKNAALKARNVERTLIQIYNKKLAEFIKIIVEKRETFISEYKSIVNDVFQQIVSEAETLEFCYTSLFLNKSFAEIEQILELHLEKEMNHYGTLIGIHKDDLEFSINKRNARQFGSQGQQRTIVLSLIVALVDYIFYKIGEYPILVLDDVMSELDEQRKLQLIHSFHPDMQIFLTTTSVEDIIEKITLPYELYEVVEGKIRKVGEC